jgi:hypothetical protein
MPTLIRYGRRVRSDDRLFPRRETSLAAFRRKILKDDSRIGALSHLMPPASAMAAY